MSRSMRARSQAASADRQNAGDLEHGAVARLGAALREARPRPHLLHRGRLQGLHSHSRRARAPLVSSLPGHVPADVVSLGGGARDSVRGARRRGSSPARVAHPGGAPGARRGARHRDLRPSPERAVVSLPRARDSAPGSPSLPPRHAGGRGRVLIGPPPESIGAAIGGWEREALPGLNARAMDDRTEVIRASYDTVAAAYVEHIAGELAGKPLDRHLLNRFAEEVRGRGPVLDLGCGPGHVTRYLADQGVSAFGIDLSHEMVRSAARLNPGLDFRVGDLRALDLPDAQLAGL